MRTFSKASLSTAFCALILSPGIAVAQQSEDEVGPELRDIVVTGKRNDTVQAGTFRNGLQVDTPLTISVIPEEVLNAQLATSALDALRNTPGVTTAAVNAAVFSNLSIRGIPVENRGNWRLNGSLPIVNLIDLPLENKVRVEVLKGASALYYGFSTPSGIVNLVMKRASADPVSSIRVFGNRFGQAGAHLDFGRQVGNIGLRLNIVAAHLDNGIDRTDGHRFLASGAFDWELAPGLTLQADAEYIFKDIVEPTTLRPIAVAGALILPVLQSHRKNIGSNWQRSTGREYNLLTRAEYKFSPAWALTLNAGVSNLTRDRRFSDFRITNATTGAGTLSVELANDNDYENQFLRGEIAGTFDTGPLLHELIVGLTRNQRDAVNPRLQVATYANNYFNPVVVPETRLPAPAVSSLSKIVDLGYYAFDRISFSDAVQLTVGVRKTNYDETTRAFSVANVETRTQYETNPTSYSAGLLVKPIDRASIYATYIEGLENARIAPSTSANAGQSLPAAASKQYEAGFKFQLQPRLLLTLAYFQIDRASSYTNPANFFVLDGLAQHKGLEASFTGNVTDDLSIYATALSLKAKQVSGAATVVGKNVENAPKFSGSLFAEYKLPFAEGLAVSAGMFHVGKRFGNAVNTFSVPSYTTFDLGMSYTTSALIGRETTFRLYADNITNKRYWGTASSSLIAPGLPASVRLSLETTL